MEYFRPFEGFVSELFTPPDGVPLEDCFQADCAALFIPVPDGVPVEVGWSWDGTTLTPPPDPQPSKVETP
jgi:hypothetical protein